MVGFFTELLSVAGQQGLHQVYNTLSILPKSQSTNHIPNSTVHSPHLGGARPGPPRQAEPAGRSAGPPARGHVPQDEGAAGVPPGAVR